ncbi:hypothetical protein GCM10010429_47930 [Micromonospora olivasterospora]
MASELAGRVRRDDGGSGVHPGGRLPVPQPGGLPLGPGDLRHGPVGERPLGGLLRHAHGQALHPLLCQLRGRAVDLHGHRPAARVEPRALHPVPREPGQVAEGARGDAEVQQVRVGADQVGSVRRARRAVRPRWHHGGQAGQPGRDGRPLGAQPRQVDRARGHADAEQGHHAERGAGGGPAAADAAASPGHRAGQ